MTNADRIRNMNNNELANFISNIHTIDISAHEYIYKIYLSNGSITLQEFSDIEEWLKKEIEKG